MKKKISRILGVGLSVILLVSLMVAVSPAAPASAGKLSLTPERGPDALPVDGGITMDGVEIVAMVTSGDTVYAATTGPTANTTYKSSNGGATWVALTRPAGPFASPDNLTHLAVAPDDANVVVAINQAGQVLYSDNGGGGFNDMAMTLADNIYCIDVSEGPVRSVAVGGDNTTAAPASEAQVYVYTLGGWSPQWTALISDPTTQGFYDAESVKAVKFSPNYATDKIILTVTDPLDAAAGNVTFQVYWGESRVWNDQITGFIDYTAANLAILNVAANQDVISASIDTPSSYMGYDEGERVVFIGLATADAAAPGGVYRFSDNYMGREGTLTLWNGATPGQIGSIDYNDAGKLLAGDYNANQVFSCLDPMAPMAKFERVNSYKQPSGVQRTLVGWCGDTAVAATQGDESAFAASTDDGYAFNDISMVNTAVSVTSDFAVNADGSKLYVATYDNSEGSTNYDVSLWVKASSWQRVYSRRDVAVDANAAYMVRIAPDDDAVVYMVACCAQDMWVSQNSGMTSWKSIRCYNLAEVTDFVVQSADVVYAVYDKDCSKTTNGGSSWGRGVKLGTAETGYTVANMITLAPNNDVLVGGSDGTYAVSTDEGASFTWYENKPVPAGNVYLAADPDYASNGIIYIAGGTTVTRSNAPPGPPLGNPNFSANHTVTGIAQYGDITYVLSANTTGAGYDSQLHRCLNLQTAVASGKDTTLWSERAAGSATAAVVLDKALRLSFSTAPKLWALGATTPIYSLEDTLALVSPTMSAPSDKFEVEVNPRSGSAYDITFSWQRQVTEVNKMDMQIATDAGFDALILNQSYTVTTDTVAQVIGPSGAGDNRIFLMPGYTYYWRVRVSQDGPMYSPWSATRELNVLGAIAFDIESPVEGSTGVSITPTFVWTEYPGALHYEIEIAEEPTLATIELFSVLDIVHSADQTFYKVEDEEALKFSTTYYWRVRAITGVAPPAVGKGPAPPAPSSEWLVGVFTTEAEPVEEEPDTIVVEPPDVTVQPPTVNVEAPPAAIPTYLLWTIVGIGAVLLIALIVLIVRTRRVV